MTEPTHCVYRKDPEPRHTTMDAWVSAGAREVARGSRDYCEGFVTAMRSAFPFGRVEYWIDAVPRTTPGEET